MLHTILIILGPISFLIIFLIGGKYIAPDNTPKSILLSTALLITIVSIIFIGFASMLQFTLWLLHHLQ